MNDEMKMVPRRPKYLFSGYVSLRIKVSGPFNLHDDEYDVPAADDRTAKVRRPVDQSIFHLLRVIRKIKIERFPIEDVCWNFQLTILLRREYKLTAIHGRPTGIS